MKKSKTLLLAALISFTAHGVFFASTPFIKVQGMRHVVDQTRRMFRLRGVEEDASSVRLFKGSRPSVPSLKMAQPVSPVESGTLRKMKAPESPAEDISPDVKKKKMHADRAMEISGPGQQKFDPGDILKSAAEIERKKAAPGKRSLARRLAAGDIPASTLASRSADAGLSHAASQDGLEGPYGEQSSWAPSGEGPFRPGTGEIASLEGSARLGDYEDIGRYLKVNIMTYEDPATGERYFKVLISAVGGSHLAVIPKEITFLIDSSKSITEEKLSYIKEGVLDSLGGLNPGDSFNLVAFRGDLVKFRPDPVRATDRTAERAGIFIKDLEATGQTDVENALLGIIKEPIDHMPSYIILITDGRPTTGVTDSRRIIQEITRRNNMVRPIFCFGGGRRVNRYLLEFIAYQNRAWSRFAATTHDMGGEFEEFYSQIKDPLLLNVRYQLSGVDTGEVYPKYLSDFYRGRPFVIYGRYDTEKVFSMQLLGEINGTTKELIFRGDLEKAEKGGPDIAEEWAFMKMYYLISRNTMGAGSPVKLRREIDRLSAKYGIKTPYDIEDGD